MLHYHWYDRWTYTLPILLCYTIVVLTLLSYSVSPLYQACGGDSSIFIIMGRGLLAGRVPYLDIFDHKGPMLWAIEALGLSICNGRTGIFVMEIISWTASAFILYKLAQKFFTGWLPLLSAILLISLIAFANKYGNNCEEFALPFITLSYYLFFDSLNTDKTAWWKYAVMGACFSIVLNIRINDGVGQFAGFFLMWIVQAVKTGNYKRFFVRIIWGIAGASAVMLPIVLYYHAHQAIDALIYGSFTYNAIYAANEDMRIELIKQKRLNIVIPLMIAVYFRWKNKTRCQDDNRKNLLNLIILSLCISLLTIGTRSYAHYFIVIYCPSVMALTVMIEHIIHKGKRQQAYTLAVIAALFVTNIVIMTVKLTGSNKKDNYYIAHYQDISRYIPEAYKDSVWNYHSNSYSVQFFMHNNMLPMNRILCTNLYKVGWWDSDIKAAIATNFWNKKDYPQFVKPKFILFYTENGQSMQDTFVLNNYRIVVDRKLRMYQKYIDKIKKRTEKG